MSKLYTGGPYKQANGNAITASSTNVKTGAVKAAGDTTTVVKKSPLGQGDNLSVKSSPSTFMSAADFSLVYDSVSAASNDNGLLAIDGTSYTVQYAVGDFIRVVGNQFAVTSRIVRISGTNLTLQTAYSSTIANDITSNYASIYKLTGSFNTLEKGNTIMRGYTHNAHRVAVSKYQSGQSERDMNYYMRSLRTRQVATAIRAGYWNKVTGTFSVTPSNSNDYGAEMTPISGTTPDTETQRTTGTKSRGGTFAMRTGQPYPISKNHNTND